MFGIGLDSHATQTERILKAIKKRPGITNYELAGITFKFNSRISDLRKDGYDIRAVRVWKEGRATGTYRYQLLPDREATDVS